MGGKSIPKDNGDNLTKEELLFLHLLDYKDNDEYIVSDMVTIQGIHSVLKCDLGYITRLLKRNRKKGYIKKKKVKVKNKLRIQNGFFLTERGEKVALKIDNYVNNK